MDPMSIYLHIPFCQHRCGYCDFNTYAGINHLIPSYIDALVKEIRFFAGRDEFPANSPVHTIYFGGGTPSLVPPEEIEKVFSALHQSFRIDSNCEITLEVNPGTTDKSSLEGYRRLGVNRLSIGIQSTHPAELQMLERLHGYTEARTTVEDARVVGYRNISLDLIYGLPDQEIRIWEQSLQDVLSLQPDHMSLYSLTVEDGTPLAVKVNSGAIPQPDPDLAADCYDLAQAMLKQAGFVHYEISNWAKKEPDGSCSISRHNRHYWLNIPFVGLGAGAHSFIGGYRMENERSPYRYIKQLNEGGSFDYPFTPVSTDYTNIDQQVEMQETMMMGLRLLTEGVATVKFKNRFGLDMRDVFSSEIDRLLRKGLVYWGGNEGDHLMLAEQAYFVANQVFLEFI